MARSASSSATVAPRDRTGARPPWKRSWLYCAPREAKTLAWIALIHVAAVAGLVLLPFPGLPVVLGACALFALGGLGTTVAYHRALAHRALALDPLVERTLVALAMFNGSGDPVTWVANHRHHHAHSDTEADLSSPRQGGFAWAHLRWLWQAEQAAPERYCPDVTAGGHSRWARLQAPILASSLLAGLLAWPFVGGLGALAACTWLGPVRLVFALHVQCTINSVCHLGKATSATGTARNVAWLAPFHFGQGENWHANHHERGNDARFGRAWWQIDLGWTTIALLERFGLAEAVRVDGRVRGPARAARRRRR